MIRFLTIAFAAIGLVLVGTLTSTEVSGQTATGAPDERLQDVVWDRGFPPKGCFWECTREEGCGQTSSKPMAFPPNFDLAKFSNVTLPGQLIAGIPNPQAPAFTLGSGAPSPPRGVYSRGTSITQSVTIPQSDDGWLKTCGPAGAALANQADGNRAANSAIGQCTVSGTVMGRGRALFSGETMILKGGFRISGNLQAFVAASTEPKPIAELTFSGCSKGQIASIQQCAGTVLVISGKYQTSFSDCTDEQAQNVREIANRYTTDTWEALNTASSVVFFVNPSAPK
ncbi:MAG: hypothetical protein ABL878_19105 [Burkholderiales bacterium]